MHSAQVPRSSPLREALRVFGSERIRGNAILVILVLAVRYARTMYFEAALLIAVFGFLGSSAMAKFLLRGEVIE